MYTRDDEEDDEEEEWFRDEPIEEGDQNSKWPRIKVSREERTKWYIPPSPTDDISKSILYRVKDYFVANLANCMYIYIYIYRYISFFSNMCSFNHNGIFSICSYSNFINKIIYNKS